MITLTVSFAANDKAHLLAPIWFATPHVSPISVDVTGAKQRLVGDSYNGQHLLCLSPTTEVIEIAWRFGRTACAYPEAMFEHRDSRYTRGASSMCQGVLEAVGDIEDPRARLRAVIAYVTELFTYGHAEMPFYEGHDAIPELCGLTVGSCVDINANLIAACRAVGIEAGYVTGYFIPAEKRSHTTDMHCWVVTRTAGLVEEWDIAHHLKMDTRDIQPGLNPKPGVRLPMSHSMGWNIPMLGVEDAKLMAEPMWLQPDGSWQRCTDLKIHLEGYDELLR
jgi:hypothetical protein